ncbi:MAG: CPXCG motif-containing cysteine-rich protein [Gammaproteobacteria bacterium]|nr:CPXCG motif-containing cysteine-rich protein [Gammaproteobacteria bacterium]MDH3560347.1 CPXCG motif-containing cysteine-rich protein [Gammaproteobacteria bacterium]
MLEPASVDCPYCGESFETVVDCSGGSQDCIEDCPACCRPIEIHIEIGLNQELDSLTTRRDDD